MSELSVGSLSGLAANSYVIDVASGSSLDVTNATGTLPSAQLPAGSILQVVNTYITSSFSTNSTSYQNIGLSASITPRSTSSKIFIMGSFPLFYANNPAGASVFEIFRGADVTGVSLTGAKIAANYTVVSGNQVITASFHWLDSPSTASSVSYAVGLKTENASNTAQSNGFQVLTLMEVAG